MDKPIRRCISVSLGTLGVLFGIYLLPVTFSGHVPAGYGFLHGAMMAAGIGILEHWWRTRPQRHAAQLNVQEQCAAQGRTATV